MFYASLIWCYGIKTIILFVYKQKMEKKSANIHIREAQIKEHLAFLLRMTYK